MPTYKDSKTGTYYCKFYYTDWKGEKKQKLKRGFKLQREAKEWERLFLEQFAKNPDISFKAMYLKYKEYITPRIRESTASVRFTVIDKHILPYFEKRIVSDITPADIAAWQTEILSKGLSASYIRMANVYLKAIFNYAVEYSGLTKSPCGRTVGSSKNKEPDFWTPEEYKRFSKAIKENPQHFIMFEILYYTGMRAGEMLALTLEDIGLEERKISINKTYYRITGKDLTNPPKTEKSERIIDIPAFLADEIKDYIRRLYKPSPTDRLFIKTTAELRRIIKAGADKAEIKQIRVHDLRHSHASALIDSGANPLLIAQRLGHASPTITMNRYSHLFESHQKEIIAKLEKIKN